MQNTIYVVTNDPNLKSNQSEFYVIWFNPWGFSREGVVQSFLKEITSVQISTHDRVYTRLLPLYFGRRCKLVEKIIKQRYPNNYMGEYVK